MSFENIHWTALLQVPLELAVGAEGSRHLGYNGAINGKLRLIEPITQRPNPVFCG